MAFNSGRNVPQEIKARNDITDVQVTDLLYAWRLAELHNARVPWSGRPLTIHLQTQDGITRHTVHAEEPGEPREESYRAPHPYLRHSVQNTCLIFLVASLVIGGVYLLKKK